MKDTPILMCGEMVRATLEDRKTQTRRVVKDQFHACLTGDCPHQKQTDCDETLAALCPYGSIGSTLWVREAWTLGYASMDDKPEPYVVVRGGGKAPVLYRANQLHNDAKHKWKPSIHMPRKFSRLTLEIIEVRVERVQDITEADAIAEGVTPIQPERWCKELRSKVEKITAVRQYQLLWDDLNKARGYGWDKNCWVWVLQFKRV